MFEWIERSIREKVAREIEEACYFIPIEFVGDVASGKPYAYIQGITNGRNQAIDILRGKKKSDG